MAGRGPSSHAKPLIAYRLNIPLLVGSLAIVAIFIPTLILVHAAQKGRVAEAMRERAERLEQDGDYVMAAQALERYLLLQPDDDRQKIELARLYDLSAESGAEIQRSITLNMIALGVSEANSLFAEREPEIRRRLIKRLMQVGRFEDAMDEIAALAGPEPDVELVRFLSLCRYQLMIAQRSHRMTVVSGSQLPEWLDTLQVMHPADLLNRALQDSPGDIELTTALANVCLGNPEWRKNSALLADASMQDLKARAQNIARAMLQSHQDDYTGYLAYYAIMQEILPGDAEDAIKTAVEMAPDEPQVLRQAAYHYLGKSQNAANRDSDEVREWLAQSETMFRQLMENPSGSREVAVYQGLGDVLRLQGAPRDALDVWETGIRAAMPPTTSLHFRIVEAYLNEGKFEIAEEALAQLDATVRAEGAILTRPAQLAASRGVMQLRAAIHSAQGDYVTAVEMMEKVASSMRELDATNQAEVWSFLASAYQNLRQWDRAATAFEQALYLVPSGVQYRRGAAAAWFAAGRADESLKLIKELNPKAASDWVRIAESILAIQQRQRQNPVLWQDFDQALSQAQRAAGADAMIQEKPWIIDLLSIEGRVVRATFDEQAEASETATKLLLKLRDQHPQSQELAVRSLQRIGAWTQDRELLQSSIADFRQRFPEDPQGAISQASLLAANGRRQEAIDVLQQQMAASPDDLPVRQALIELSGTPQAAETSSGTKDSSGLNGIENVPALVALARVALTAPLSNDPESPLQEQVKQWSEDVLFYEDALRALEGESGTEWRYVRARRLLALSATGENIDLSQISQLVSYLQQNRPQWSSTYMLAGLLAERQNDKLSAIREFYRAISLGASDLQVYERLVGLLFEQGSMTEVAAVVDQIGPRASRSSRLSELAMNMANASSRSDNALRLAQQGTVSRPNDPVAWIWLAQVLTQSASKLSGEERTQTLSEVEEALDEATRRSPPNDIRARGAKFNYYVSTGQQDKAEQMVAEVEAALSLPAATRASFLADAYRSLGQNEKAIQSYQAALSAGGNRSLIGSRLVQLQMALGRRDEAIQEMEQMLKAAPQDNDVRRLLATSLAARGAAADWQRVEELLEGSDEVQTSDDRRLRAELHMQNGSLSDLSLAQGILERLVFDNLEQQQKTEDRFRLATVYVRKAKALQLANAHDSEALKLMGSAELQLKEIATSKNATKEHIYAYGDFLLEREIMDKAREQLARLQRVAPDDFLTVFLAARTMKSDGKTQEAIDSLQAWLQEQSKNIDQETSASRLALLQLQTGRALASLGAEAEGEVLMRSAVELDANVSLDYVQAMTQLSDSAARKAAVEFLLARALQTEDPQTARMLAGLISIGATDQDLLDQVEPVLEQIYAANADNQDLLLAMADMWLSQNKQEKAIEIYKRVIRINPNDVVALNNLANLLADQPGAGQEALQYIEQALRIAGNDPLLLDTKGMIQLNNGQIDDAIPTLRSAATASQDPRLAFHLWTALRQGDRLAEANAVRRMLKIDELKTSLLTPADQRELLELENTMEKAQ